MSKKEKQIRISGWMLVGVYLFLLGLNTLHYHHYNYYADNSISDTAQQPLQANDIIQDFTGSCFIHHFANTLLNYSHSSSEVLKTKPLLNDYLHPFDNYIPSPDQYTSIGLRAPPASI